MSRWWRKPVVLRSSRKFPFRFDEHRGGENNRMMKTKLAIVAGLTAAVLSSGCGVALANPDPPGPDPNAPKCWEPTTDGWAHTELAPCGWTFSSENGWQQLPPPPPPPG
jgi:hypothetical protein